MMKHELFKVLARLFQLQHQYECLLTPVTGLEEIVGLEQRFMLAVREAIEHGRCVEIPQRALLHDIEPKWSKDGEVHCCVYLLHESCLLASSANAASDCKRVDEPLHEELSREAENDGVEQDERQILLALAVHVWSSRVVRAQWI